MKQLCLYFLISLFINSFLIAQERVILRPNGEKTFINKSLDLREAIKISKIKSLSGQTVQHSFPHLDFSAAGIIDTLNYVDLGLFTTNFGFYGQDVMFMWFEAPADLTIKAAGFSCSEDSAAINGADVGLRLIKLNWTREQLDDFGTATYQGYYPSDGDGFNNSDYFGENGTGDWIMGDQNNPIPPWEHMDYDLWSDSGRGVHITPEYQVEAGNYQWIEMNVLNYEPKILKGEIFAVVLEHNGENLDQEKFGFYADNTIGFPGWKYYENGRLSSDNPGWWVRMYTWDFAVVVDITGDTPPNISNVTNLQTTISIDPRTVEATITDENVTGGAVGVASANLFFSIDGRHPYTISMTSSGNLYSADLPGPALGTEVKYWIEAVDVEGNSSRSIYFNYFIFRTESIVLVVFNGFSGSGGYPQSYYFGAAKYPDPPGVPTYTIAWDHDVWSYGPLTKELVDQYKMIVEISTTGPNDYNNEVIRDWLYSNPYPEVALRNYLLAGQEWLQPTHTGTYEYPIGSFEYDILGITHSYIDINYSSPGDEKLASVVSPVEGSLLGSALFSSYNQLLSDSSWSSPMLYDPSYEIGVDNLLDGADFLDDVDVCIKGIGIDGITYNIGGSRTITSGSKIVFLSYDPLSLSMARSNYWWWGIMSEAPQTQALYWLYPLIPSVDENSFHHSYWISQNYPNPFNPTTKIKYQVPQISFVKLKVYDILGREVTTLVNKDQRAGSYEVEFNSSSALGGQGLSSGVYFYSISAGEFTDVKKMLLLK